MRKRLDQILSEKQLAPSRSRARDAIERECVSVAGKTVTKAGYLVDPTAEIIVRDGAGLGFVSRGALKLSAALEAFKLDPSGRTALDIGASTGGFTEVLLSHGAKKVYCVDVGHRQLHPDIADDPRVVSLEGQDARDLSDEIITDPITALVADVSFISLTKVIPAALSLAAPGCWLVALIKPQFEVGSDHVGKDGVVKDFQVREKAVQTVCNWVSNQTGWRLIGTRQSPITGGSGNVETLVGAIRND